MKFKSIYISDVHLGTRFSQAEKLLDFLRDYESENLYLVGDIIDGWAIKRKFWWAQSHSDVVQKVLRKARKGTKVYFIAGNHDEFLRPFAPFNLGNNLFVKKEMVINIKNRRYLVTHGDFFDSVTMTKKWLAVVGDYGYDILLHLNHIINKITRKIGFKRYWSLSKYVKDNVKKSVSFITDYETVLVNHAKHKHYDGVICGHIHKPEIKMIDGVEYINCGDWVENCSAILQDEEGKFEVVSFLD